MSEGKNKAMWEFAGKLITPITIIILVLSFKSTVEERLGQASEVSVLGSSFKFNNNAFKGQLNVLEIYYLIQAHRKSNTWLDKGTLKDEDLSAVYLLKSKALLKVEETSSIGGMEGLFIGMELTPEGQKLVNELGLR